MGRHHYSYRRGSWDVWTGLILPLLVFSALVTALIKVPQTPQSGTSNPFTIRIEHNYPSTEADARATLGYINQLRRKYGKRELVFDSRTYALAKARAMDMRAHNYLDHTNPVTGQCPDRMKTQYGLAPTEYVAENAFGNPEYVEGMLTRIQMKPMSEAVDSWMTSRGHRYNLLSDKHTAGAIACHKNMCVFLGLNHSRFGEGCHTAAEGQQFWKTAPLAPGEV